LILSESSTSTPLLEAAQNLDWGWFLNPLRTESVIDSRMSDAQKGEQTKEASVFAVRLLKGDRIVGSTSYFGVATRHKRVEIGSTWYIRDVLGTAVNPECKYLMLRHAFEDWGAGRVQFTTDSNNARSQRAIEKLGAKREGSLRNHAIGPDGTFRDSVVYSIVAAEWPSVRDKLIGRLEAFRVAAGS
jgi:RimJ/RimL family protein N-acetyltransferase